MIQFNPSEIWFVTGSQSLYDPETFYVAQPLQWRLKAAQKLGALPFHS